MRDGRYPDMPFNQQMGVPIELTLRRTSGGLRIFNRPVRELATLRRARHTWSDLSLQSGGHDDPLALLDGELLEIIATFDPGDAEEIGLRLRGQPISYSVERAQLTALGAAAPLELEGGRLTLQVLVDRASIEVFANDGRVALSNCFVPDPADQRIAAFARGRRGDNSSSTSGRPARLVALEAYELASAWPVHTPPATAR